MKEQGTHAGLLPARQAQIDVVTTAYASVVAKLSYLTMPVTAGKRLYELMEKYGVRSKAELEKIRPGILWEEVILPNVENGKQLAHKLHREQGRSLVVPGIFDAQQFDWGQEDYMVLWLRFIVASAREIFLAPGWEYSTGGAMEFVQGMMIQHRFVARAEPIAVRNEMTSEVDLMTGALAIAYAIRDLRKRGFDERKLVREFTQLAHLAYTLAYLAENHKQLWEQHTWGTPSCSYYFILSAAHSLDIKPRLLMYS